MKLLRISHCNECPLEDMECKDDTNSVNQRINTNEINGGAK